MYYNSVLCTVQVMLVSLEKLATSADVCVAALDRLLTLLPLLSGTAALLLLHTHMASAIQIYLCGKGRLAFKCS